MSLSSCLLAAHNKNEMRFDEKQSQVNLFAMVQLPIINDMMFLFVTSDQALQNGINLPGFLVPSQIPFNLSSQQIQTNLHQIWFTHPYHLAQSAIITKYILQLQPKHDWTVISQPQQIGAKHDCISLFHVRTGGMCSPTASS